MKEKNQSFEAIREYFYNSKYTTIQVDNKPILKIEFEVNSENRNLKKWKGEFIINETIFERKVILFSFIPFNISSDKQELVVELLNRINYAEDIGSFEMDYNTGRVRCKTGIQIVEDNVNSDIIIGIEESNSNLMGKYIPIIDQVNKGELLPMDAIDDDDYDNYE